MNTTQQDGVHSEQTGLLSAYLHWTFGTYGQRRGAAQKNRRAELTECQMKIGLGTYVYPTYVVFPEFQKPPYAVNLRG